MLFTAVAPWQDSASKAAEAEWREKAKKELEDWHVHQSEQMEKNKANNRLESDMSPLTMQGSDNWFIIMMCSCCECYSELILLGLSGQVLYWQIVIFFQEKSFRDI